MTSSPEGQNSTEEPSGLLAELSALAASLRREAARFKEGQLTPGDPRPLDRRLRAYADDVDEIGYKLCALDEEGWLSSSSPVDGTEVGLDITASWTAIWSSMSFNPNPRRACTDAEDITDWQRGYRACSERATKFLLGGSESGGN